MADFHIAYEPLKAFEGGYDNDPNDAGGETYAGIARNYFTSWAGWSIIDSYKKTYGISELSNRLAKDNKLQTLVTEWYKKEWWDKLGLGSLEQNLANEIFEQSVNLGKAGCGKKLQTIINAYNYNNINGKVYFTDLVIDGAVGPKTLNALAILVKNKTQSENLVHALNCMQGSHYLELAAKKPTQRKYTVGWMTRTYCPEHN